MASGVGGSDVLSTMSPEERQKNMVRAVVASTVGKAIEWYDYFLARPIGAWLFGTYGDRIGRSTC